MQTISTQNGSKSKNYVAPKPFEMERTTYCSDPDSLSQHKEKYKKFIEDDLCLNDDELCLKGRPLLEINSAIRTYFEQLVPMEMEESTFWKRYFYWK